MKKILLLLALILPVVMGCLKNEEYQEKENQSLAESITLNHNYVSLNILESQKLTYIIYPEDAKHTDVSWSSLNPDVIYVDNDGEMTAFKEGKTYVIVKILDTDITSVCKVIVKTNEKSDDENNNGTNGMDGNSSSSESNNNDVDNDDIGKNNVDASTTRCAAITKKGVRCKRDAEAGGIYCWQHKK
jgi:uncharacterized protein YjdB